MGRVINKLVTITDTHHGLIGNIKQIHKRGASVRTNIKRGEACVSDLRYQEGSLGYCQLHH